MHQTTEKFAQASAIDFARRVVNSGGSTFGRIAVCVKLTAESACLFGGTLSGIEIHEIPAGTDGLVRRVALGVKRHERAALFRIAIRASEIILAIGVEHTSFPIVEILRVFDGAIIVDVQFFSPKRRRLRSRDRCGAPRWLSGWYFLPLLPVRVSPPWHSIVCQP